VRDTWGNRGLVPTPRRDESGGRAAAAAAETLASDLHRRPLRAAV